MDRQAYIQHTIQSTLQLVSHIIQQCPPEYRVAIDTEKYMGAFSMVEDANEPDITTNATEDSTIVVDPRHVTAGSWAFAPDGSLAAEFESEGKVNAIVSRSEQVNRWLDHMQQRSQFVPFM